MLYRLFIVALLLVVAPACEEAVRDEASESHRSAAHESTSADATIASNVVRIVVMDPLAAPLSCACVKGVGQRRYDRLAEFLAKQWNCPVQLTFDESLALAYERIGREVKFVIGPRSVVEADALATKTTLQPLASLTDRSGSLHFRGLFVVRQDNPAQSLADLRGRKVVFGPEEHAEAHSAAKSSLEKINLLGACDLSTAGNMETGVFAVADGEADATVISDFLLPQMEACGKIEKGSLRTLAATEPVPFVTLFATDLVNAEESSMLRRVLLACNADRELLEFLESQRGFVMCEPTSESAGAQEDIKSTATTAWTDWRGPQRSAISPHVPKSLPQEPRLLWTVPLTGPAMGGVAAMTKYVVVPDKNAELTKDVFRCFKASSGEAVWTVEYEADKQLDYTNAPRATPVIVDELVYFQGALGDLLCVELATGKVIWQKNFVADFGATLLTWGFSVSPLVVGDKLIVAPGAKDASIVALDRMSGKTLWKTSGHAAAYAAFILATVDNRPQVVGYDVAGLGGWEPETGRRVWEMTPSGQADFHVGTPVLFAGDVLLATENNATRRYRFADGQLDKMPVAINEDFAPDTCTPVIWKERLFGTAYGELFCLDLADNLTTIWSARDDMFYDHTSLIAGNDRLLLWTTSGDLLIVRADAKQYEVVSHVRPFGEAKVESMAHPAILADRLYLRSGEELRCLDLEAM